jgi:hypothetical protein
MSHRTGARRKSCEGDSPKQSHCTTQIKILLLQGDCFVGFRYGEQTPPTQPSSQ